MVRRVKIFKFLLEKYRPGLIWEKYDQRLADLQQSCFDVEDNVFWRVTNRYKKEITTHQLSNGPWKQINFSWKTTQILKNLWSQRYLQLQLALLNVRRKECYMLKVTEVCTKYCVVLAELWSLFSDLKML